MNLNKLQLHSDDNGIIYCIDGEVRTNIAVILHDGKPLIPLFCESPELLRECERLLGLFERARVPGEITQTIEGVQQLKIAVEGAKLGQSPRVRR